MMSPQQFVAKWRHVDLKERSAAQSHFNDLCVLLGQPTPIEADPLGAWYTFEAGAEKQGGGEGFADVWKSGFFAWEYKGKHANLDKAYEQLQKYRESLRNPPLLVVSDIDSIVIHTNFTNTAKQTLTLTLDDLLDPLKLDLLRAVFTNPERLRAATTTEQVTTRAAAHFAELANLLRKYGEAPEAIARFLIQLLFCLFAEDTRLLPNDIFSEVVRKTRTQPRLFSDQLALLFRTMATGGMFALQQIPHFDGTLFDDPTVLQLDSDGLRILAEACELDWKNIEPSILGTLFERGLDPSKRSQLGAHYTGREDILLVVEPVLMAPLRRRWSEVQQQVRALAERRDRASKPQAPRLQRKLRDALTGFARELADVQVLDPACGSGNFLYVALKQLLDLWKEVSTLGAQFGLPFQEPMEGSAPHPAQFHGIEINAYAHELAQATLWIGYLQWLDENGFGHPTDPILKPLHNVLRMDAILTHDADGRPLEPEWPAADVIIGNPPFLGGGKLRSELGDEYVEALFKLYGDRLPNFSDLVCYWFEKARAMIEQGKARRAGLLATQGIRGGANRRVLERIKQTGDIFWAQSDRPWILEGAAVHVSMVGFDNGAEQVRTLDGRPAAQVNADLTAMSDLTAAKRLAENGDICFMGASPKAPFDISKEVASAMLSAPLNPNGRPNSDIVRPVASGIDLVRRSREAWTIDFGLLSLETAAQYEAPFEYVKRLVYPIRSMNRRTSYAQRWWQYAESRPGMRHALTGLPRFIATPEVAKHRVFVWVPAEVLCNQQTLIFARDDDYFFGVLHSQPHELWARRTGTQLREAVSGFRYTPTTTFEAFPFPWPPGQEPADDPRVQAIAAAARELVQQRDAWLNPPGASEPELRKRTLTNLYNQRPTWLQLAHRRLDEAVFAAYGWPPDLGDEEVLGRLLELNLERAGTCSVAEGHERPWGSSSEPG